MSKLLKKLAKRISRRCGLLCFETSEFYSLDKYLDYDEFRYIMMVYQAYRKIETIPGHIVELGVARGRNAILFGNFIKSYNDNSRRYYGFDTFSGYTEEDLKYNRNLSKDSWKNDAQFVLDRISNVGFHNICKIIEGDIKSTVPEFINNHPDIKIAMVYVDCNAYLPAISALKELQGNLMDGAVICIDEKQDGGESRAILEFAKSSNLQIIRDHEPFSLPAYIRYTADN